MERAEFATGSVNVRGSSAIHRILSFLGAVLFGIGPAARAKESDKWWEREDYDAPHDTGIQMTLGQQAELFDICLLYTSDLCRRKSASSFLFRWSSIAC